MLKINEIFTSIQGEGYHVGRSATFIRFAGCNCKCEWCDTPFDNYTEMSIEQIMAQVSHHDLVVITGGEPTMQLDGLYELVVALDSALKEVAIETNGTIEFDTSAFDWVTLSPKGNVKGGKKHVVHDVSELKIVYEGQDMQQYKDIDAAYNYLQPQALNEKSLQLCIAFILQCEDEWSLSLQMHKMIGVR